MTPEDRFADDPVLARVARTRPPVDEADLSPDGERAGAILTRVLASPRPAAEPAPPRAPAWWSRWRARRPAVGALAVAIAAVVVALVFLNTGDTSRHSSAPRPSIALGSHAVPTSDQIHLSAAKLPRQTLRAIDRTPLGRAIAQQYEQTQIDVDTGDAAQNRRALQQLQFNEAACEHAASVVAATHVTLGERYLRHDWVYGTQLQAHLDAEYIVALRDFANGDRAAGERVNRAINPLTFEVDSLTSYAFNSLAFGPGGPLPRVPGIEGKGGHRLPPDTKMP